MADDRVISSVVMGSAHLSLFFHVRNLATGRHFPVTADNATTRERREAEQPDETHGDLRISYQQTECRQFCIGAAARRERVSTG
jgi:hypothetical protein